jgi:hypothetical protein
MMIHDRRNAFSNASTNRGSLRKIRSTMTFSQISTKVTESYCWSSKDQWISGARQAWLGTPVKSVDSGFLQRSYRLLPYVDARNKRGRSIDGA